MKLFLMNLVKSISWIKALYTWAGSFLIRLIGRFVKTQDRLILFNSFGGKKYDDSSKAIYEYMLKDSRFQDYQFVWAFHDPAAFSIPRGKKIKTDTLAYFLTALKAQCWITNSGVERGLRFKKKSTLYVNTWHGTPLKCMGTDAPGISSYRSANYDIQCAQSDFEADIFARAFGMDRDRFLVCGLPRNDVLVRNDPATQGQMKQKLGIGKDKKVVLYAPTFREYERDEGLNCVLQPPISFRKWKEELGEEYVIFVRCHYEVTKLLSDEIDGDAVRDMSHYPTLHDLMLASDLLVTDYSSIMFDYSILERPILIFAYDYQTYAQKRGMYFDVRKELPGGDISEDALLSLIKTAHQKEILEQALAFKRKYVTAYGTAAKQTVDRICERLGIQ